MPLERINHHANGSWGLWKITEDEKFLQREASDVDPVPDSLSNPVKRMEWLAGRALTKLLLQNWGSAFRGIVKDEFGKPFPKDTTLHLSLSHSFPHVAAYLHRSASVGIDLEQPKTKLFRVAPRIFDPEELAGAGTDLTKHCIIWCAKEVLVKVHGKKGLFFAENLKIAPFQLASKGEITGRIIVNNHSEIVPLYYEVHRDFTVVLNKPMPT